MRSAIVKRSIVIGTRKTSVSLEQEFWVGLKQIARERMATLSSLIMQINVTPRGRNLSSALRLFVLEHYKAEALKHQAPRTAQSSSPAIAQPPSSTRQRPDTSSNAHIPSIS